jgi:hypothetical protein
VREKEVFEGDREGRTHILSGNRIFLFELRTSDRNPANPVRGGTINIRTEILCYLRWFVLFLGKGNMYEFERDWGGNKSAAILFGLAGSCFSKSNHSFFKIHKSQRKLIFIHKSQNKWMDRFWKSGACDFKESQQIHFRLRKGKNNKLKDSQQFLSRELWTNLHRNLVLNCPIHFKIWSED